MKQLLYQQKHILKKIQLFNTFTQLILSKIKSRMAFYRKPINKEPKLVLPPCPYIQMQVSTWSKDSHALYDYQTTDGKFYSQTEYIKKSLKVFRHVTTMRVLTVQVDDKKELPMEYIYIASVIYDEDKKIFHLQSADVSGVQPHPILKADHPDLFKNSYVVLRDFFKQPDIQGFPLQTGNIVRLGRIQFLVIQIKNSKQLKTLKQTSHLQLNNGVHEAVGNLEGSCKICLCEQNLENDPLINPCKCKGSCEMIHVGCLKNWIFSKVRKQVTGVAATYNFSKFQCQICKELFPKIVKLKNQTEIQMITLQKPEKPYIILESIYEKQVREDKKQRNLHLISPDQKYLVKLGRGHQCQIRVTDISVSRTHSQIHYQNDKFYLKDLKSKFGTLIKFKQEFQIKDKIRLQHSRTCFDFNLIKESPQKKIEEEQPQQIPMFKTRAQLKAEGVLSDEEDQDEN